MPSLKDLLAAVLDRPPLGDPVQLGEWRVRLHALRHALPDDSRGAQVSDALLELTRDLAVLGARDRRASEMSFQDRVWQFARLKGESTQDASAAGAEIQRRLAALSDTRAIEMIRELSLRLALAELDFLSSSLTR